MKKKFDVGHVLYWVIAILILVAIPLTWIGASQSTMQYAADECSLRQVWGRDPSSGFPEFTVEQINACNALRSKASTFFFLAMVSLLCNITAFEGVITKNVRGLVAYIAGLVYLAGLSIIMNSWFPWIFWAFFLAILLGLLWLNHRKFLREIV
jgi:hypothetical protein